MPSEQIIYRNDPLGAPESNQLLHHFVGYLRCLLYAHVDFVICNNYGKNTIGGLKPTSSSKAAGPKQKRLRRVKLSALRNYRGTTVTACIVSVKRKILAALQSKSRRINLFERNIVENSEVLKLLIENSGENSLLNERPKLLMLQIGNKYPFDA